MSLSHVNRVFLQEKTRRGVDSRFYLVTRCGRSPSLRTLGDCRAVSAGGPGIRAVRSDA